MGDRTRARCQGCGVTRIEVGSISWGGLCRACALQAVEENVDAMKAKQGYNHRRWLRGMAKYIATAELDEEPLSAQTGGHGSR